MRTTRIFKSGNSQGIRLPKDLRSNVREVEILRRRGEIVLRKRPSTVAARFERCSPEEVAISAVSIAELMYGAEKSQHPVRARRAVERIADLLRVLPFDEGAARVYGKVRSHLEKLGTPIGALDTLIGAHALSARAMLVTTNVREFERIPGLRVENWTAA